MREVIPAEPRYERYSARTLFAAHPHLRGEIAALYLAGGTLHVVHYSDVLRAADREAIESTWPYSVRYHRAIADQSMVAELAAEVDHLRRQLENHLGVRLPSMYDPEDPQ